MPKESKEAKALVDRIRTFQRSSQTNRRCADCVERGPTYVCLDFGTFVCQTCSGIHREFGHKLKSISLSEWTLREVEGLESKGNEVAAREWLNGWKREQHPEPDGAEAEKVREFLKLKYEDKKWWKKPAEVTAVTSKETVAPPVKDAATPARQAEAAAVITSPNAKSPAGVTSPASKLKAAVPKPAVVCDLLSEDLLNEPAPVVPSVEATPLVPDLNLLQDSIAPLAKSPDKVMEEKVVDLVLDKPDASNVQWTANFDGQAALKAADEITKLPQAMPDVGGGLGGGDLMGLDFSCTAPKTDSLVGARDKSPIMEPAEEPAPSVFALNLTPAGVNTVVGPKSTSPGSVTPSSPTAAAKVAETNGQKGVSEQLKEAVLNGSNHGDLQRLFAMAAEEKNAGRRPSASAPAPERIAAFSAFDELATGSTPQRTTPQPTLPVSSANSGGLLGPAGLEALNCGSAAMPPPLPTFSNPTLPGIQNAPTSQMSPITDFKPQANLTPQQLASMRPEELMKMQAMISQALHTRSMTAQAQQQPAFSPAKRLEPEQWQPVASTPPKEFNDLLAAFHEKNPSPFAGVGVLADQGSA